MRRQNIHEFIFLLHYQPERFIKTLGNGKAFDAVFHYECLEKDLSTAGSIKFIGEKITETSLLFSADILAEVPVEAMLGFHRNRNALVTIALHPMPAPLPFGIVLRDPNGKIKRFLEKPTWPQVYGDWINSAVYIIEPELVDHIPNHGAPSFFEKEVFPPLAKKGAAIYGFPLSGYWRDVGTPEDLRGANLDFLHGRLPEIMLTEEEQLALQNGGRKSFLAAPSSTIAADAIVQDSVIGKNCRIKAGAKIFRSVILDNVKIKSGAQIDGAIIMNDVRVGERAVMEEDSLIGAGAKLNEAVVVQKNGSVRPGKKIAPKKIITAAKVLPTGYIRRFVDGGCLLGSGSENFSCDFMRWVGKAFGQYQRNLHKTTSSKRQVREKLFLATSSLEVLNFWKLTLAQGMAASGYEVALLHDVTLPIARRELMKNEYDGGIYLGLDDFSGLLRLVLLHHNGENFSTSEACALERIDAFDEAAIGEQYWLNEAHAREEYLDALLAAANLQESERPLRRITLGVLDAATEKAARRFFEKLRQPVEIIYRPLEIDTDIRRSVFSFQQDLQRARNGSPHFIFLMGSLGERVRALLPESKTTPFGVSDIVLARILSNHKQPNRKLLEGWLMPEISHKTVSGAKSSSLQISGMNSSMTALARERGFDLWYGFDGNGGVTVSEWSGYHDALMALAHVLPYLNEENYQLSRNVAQCYSNAYHLLPCTDEAKARVVRRLIESFAEVKSEVNDGVKFELESGWVLVRLCAGREALEVFKYEKKFGACEADKSEIGNLLQRILKSLGEWIEEAKEEPF